MKKTSSSIIIEELQYNRSTQPTPKNKQQGPLKKFLNLLGCCSSGELPSVNKKQQEQKQVQQTSKTIQIASTQNLLKPSMQIKDKSKTNEFYQSVDLRKKEKSELNTKRNSIEKKIMMYQDSGNLDFILNSSGSFLFLLKQSAKEFKISNSQTSRFELEQAQYATHESCLAPFQLCKYIAMRCKEQILVETNMQYAQHTVQVNNFAKYAEHVISFVSNPIQLECSHNNLQLYKTHENISIIQNEFSAIKTDKMMADIVFINFTKRQFKSFSELQNLMYKALSFCKNLVILVHAKFNCQYVINMLSKYINQNEQKLQQFISYQQIKTFSLRTSLEIEKIVINETLEYKIIYFGDICEQSKNEEISQLASFLLQESTEYKGIELSGCLPHLLEFISNQNGMVALMNLILLTLMTIQYPKSLLDQFFDKAFELKLITEGDIQKVKNQISQEEQQLNLYQKRNMQDSQNIYPDKSPKLIGMFKEFQKNLNIKSQKLHYDDLSSETSYSQKEVFKSIHGHCPSCISDV